MPILHIQYSGREADKDGKSVTVDPRSVLQKRGPVVQVTVSLGSAVAQTLQQSGQVSRPRVELGTRLRVYNRPKGYYKLVIPDEHFREPSP